MKMPEDFRLYLASIGKKGGSKKSAAKTAAVRLNGAKGGRPKGSKNKKRTEKS
jgi:hypothetical protein